MSNYQIPLIRNEKIIYKNEGVDMSANIQVLIVDDNKDILFAVKYGLEQNDGQYKVEGVTNAVECLDFIDKGYIPDIIILDIMMPYKDGWELFAELKQKPNIKNIPIVFLTAKVDGFSKGFGAISAQDYITKPFEIEDLKNRIELILKR
jgi:DNA-binding response OmpR family regulator